MVAGISAVPGAAALRSGGVATIFAGLAADAGADEASAARGGDAASASAIGGVLSAPEIASGVELSEGSVSDGVSTMLIGLTRAGGGAEAEYAESVGACAGENFVPTSAGAGAFDEVPAAAAAAEAAADFHVSEAVVSEPGALDCGYAIALTHRTNIIAATDAPKV